MDLTDYQKEETLQKYLELTELPFVKYFREYTLYQLYPDFKNKIVLDIPCSIGTYSLKMLQKGATHVICSDLISEQFIMAEKLFKDNNFDNSKYTFKKHDAKIPKILTNLLADIALVLHLFCFADNYEELVSIAKCIHMNLSSDGEMISYHCGPIFEDKLDVYEKANNAKIITYDKPNNGKDWPRYFCSCDNGFKLPRNLWPNDIVEKAILEAGFKEIRYEKYRKDPEYQGDNLALHEEYAEFKLIIAKKFS